MKLVLGWSGTQDGLTEAQLLVINNAVAGIVTCDIHLELHHGMCTGADQQIHHVFRDLFAGSERSTLKIVGHPGVTKDGRIYKRASVKVDEIREPKFFLDRNRDIVSEAEVMWTGPGSQNEIRRSGTWSTIRYAGTLMVPTVLFLPDGLIDYKF